MTEKEKEYNNKWLLSYHLLLPLQEINKLSDHEIDIMVNFINEEYHFWIRILKYFFTETTCTRHTCDFYKHSL